MDYEDWEPIYEEILQDFNYSKQEDIRAAKLLDQIRGSDRLDFIKQVRGSRVEVLGPYAEDYCEEYVFIAGSAISRFEDIEGNKFFLVTDLDGDTSLQKNKNVEGIPTFIHAHGDNQELIKRWGKRFRGKVVSTCQCRPINTVYNFGGFTDGDRCVFIADHFGAEHIILNGWDFDRPAKKIGDDSIKKKKLRWAKKLIHTVGTPISFK